MNYKYFIIPIASVPQNPTYTVWFVTWALPYPTWSQERPDITPDTIAWAVGVVADEIAALGAVRGTAGDALPQGTIVLDGTKEIPPPERELFRQDAASDSGFHAAFTQWLTARSA